MNTAVIVAAGASRRMGFDKLFAPLCGRYVISHSIAAYEACDLVSEIILVVRQDRINAMREIVEKERFRKVSKILPGGAERHLSVWNGLQAVSAETRLIAIHDGARPLTTPETIAACFELARREGAACVAVPIHDTVKRAASDQRVIESVERHGLWAMQTPQIFAAPLIVQAYGALIDSGEPCTDEVSAVQRLGIHIRLLPGGQWNFKITIPQDLQLAEQVLRARKQHEEQSPSGRRR